MIALYGSGNVSTCGFSSGAALAMGMAAHNSALGRPLPQPKHIITVAPGEVPWNDEERARMQALNASDVAIDYAFMAKGEKLMRHGHNDVPDYMLAPSRGDYTGVGDIHFYYSTDEVLYGALPEFKAACEAGKCALHRDCPPRHDALLLHAALFQGGEGGLRHDRRAAQKIEGREK